MVVIKLQPCLRQQKILVKDSFYYPTHIAISHKGFRIFYSKIVTSLMQYDNEMIKKIYIHIPFQHIYTVPQTVYLIMRSSFLAPRFHIKRNVLALY